MKKTVLHASICGLTLLMAACANDAKKECLGIDLSVGIEQEKGTAYSLIEVSEGFLSYPLETTDSILLSDIPGIRFVSVTAKEVWLVNEGIIYRFGRETGKCLARIDRKGEGPEEYIYASDVLVDTTKKSVLVYDANRKRVNEYDFEGRYKGSVPNDFIGSFALWDDDTFVVSYSPFANQKHRVGLYDRDWKLVRQLMPVEDDTRASRQLIAYDELVHSLGHWNIVPSFNDTIFRVDEEGVVPVFVASKGDLKITEEVATDLSKKRERAKYIYGESGFLTSSYYFSHYYYQNKMYDDVWNVRDGSLVYRNIRRGPEEKDGLLLIFGDKEIRVRPKYVSGDYLYCLVPAGELLEIVPSTREDDNPAILELKLRKL
ncbi:MAG: 6-bladed beta-propeller [Odoribacteraceae bacterium]|jgi:hypothetical protein|nr:6-bladed beta-propeller [Odoribacteraceae bacterium]